MRKVIGQIIKKYHFNNTKYIWYIIIEYADLVHYFSFVLQDSFSFRITPILQKEQSFKEFLYKCLKVNNYEVFTALYYDIVIDNVKFYKKAFKKGYTEFIEFLENKVSKKIRYYCNCRYNPNFDIGVYTNKDYYQRGFAYACKYGNMPLVEQFLEVCRIQENDDWIMPYEWACKKNQKEVIEFFNDVYDLYFHFLKNKK